MVTFIFINNIEVIFVKLAGFIIGLYYLLLKLVKRNKICYFWGNI